MPRKLWLAYRDSFGWFLLVLGSLGLVVVRFEFEAWGVILGFASRKEVEGEDGL